MNNLKKSDTLIDNDKEREMHSKSDNIRIIDI